MSLPSINPTKTKAWKALENHFQEMKARQMQDIFSEDTTRATRLKIEWQDFYLDYSKNRITDETLSLLLKLAEEVKLKEAIKQQFSGEKINETENRAVLHSALRDFENMKLEVKATLQRMELFSEEIISGIHKGF
ncbi:MAG TPA: glucose-6-phosphate isomerase, partial [Aequorivita sp.]|nr:glucose-6-phosphate isomerase [Aequorivita sp.]